MKFPFVFFFPYFARKKFHGLAFFQVLKARTLSKGANHHVRLADYLSLMFCIFFAMKLQLFSHVELILLFQAMDIDEILQRAETLENVEDTSVNEDLLSQFKVSSVWFSF